MTNNNDGNDQPGGDWQSPQAEAAPEAPAATPNLPATTHPLANNNFDFGAFIDVVKLVFQRAKDGPVLKAFVGLSLLGLAWGLLTGGVQFVAYFVSGFLATIFGIFFGLVALIAAPIAFIIYGAQYSLYRPLAQQLSKKDTELAGPIDLIKSSKDILLMMVLSIFIVTLASIIVSPCFLLPGMIVAFLFSQAPYLIATQDADLSSAFTRSFERAKTHWHVLIMGAVMMLVAFFIVTIPLAIFFFINNFLGPVAYLTLPVAGWLAATTLAVIGFLVSTAAFVTIDELEGQRVIEG